MGMGTSTFVTRWINFLTMICSWLFGCPERHLHILMGLSDYAIHCLGGNPGLHSIGANLFFEFATLAVHGTYMRNYPYCFSCSRFIVTNNGSGHSVTGLRYKEYQLQDFSSWFLKETLKQYKSAKLTPIEAGCCRPPSQCGYPAANASYYDLTFHPVSPNNDCKRYKNSRAIKCYDCDSCKAGVAQYMKTEWRVVAIFNVVLFVVLSIVYFVGCCARRNAARRHSKA
ncbi:hypothetical protein V8G54_001539 [Vigna mungo]|uniref:Tetraspanin-10 n=1 Tax=Vigna mungo TaxID=3915 RepID=A0AAQ3P795_VIGMU